MWGVTWACGHGEVSPEITILSSASPTPATPIRSLLIECSNHILRPHGRTRHFNSGVFQLAARGGKQAKSKAVVAVARKLAVLLHRLWTAQEPYMPFYAVAGSMTTMFTRCDDTVF